jgi:hypothetical protein
MSCSASHEFPTRLTQIKNAVRQYVQNRESSIDSPKIITKSKAIKVSAAQFQNPRDQLEFRNLKDKPTENAAIPT